MDEEKEVIVIHLNACAVSKGKQSKGVFGLCFGTVQI